MSFANLKAMVLRTITARDVANRKPRNYYNPEVVVKPEMLLNLIACIEVADLMRNGGSPASLEAYDVMRAKLV